LFNPSIHGGSGWIDPLSDQPMMDWVGSDQIRRPILTALIILLWVGFGCTSGPCVS